MKKTTLVFLLFIVMTTVVFTYPLVLKINSAIPGFENTDEPQASIWYYWWQKRCFHNKTDDFGECSYISFPFGVNFKHGTNFYPIWLFLTRWISMLTNPIFTYNAQVFLSFILSAVFMYWLVLFMTKDRASAFISGVIYAFLPYHFVRIWQHLGLAQIQWMPLLILSIFKLREKQSLKNVIFCAVAFLLVAFFDYYYTYFMSVAVSLFVVYEIVYSLKIFKKPPYRFVCFLIVSCLAMLLVLSPILIRIAGGYLHPVSAQELLSKGYIRSFQDLFTQSAKPLSYLLPATTHPVFGKFSEGLIGSPLYGVSYTEHTLYLGWTPIILAFIACRNWRKRRKTMSVIASPEGAKQSQKRDCFVSRLRQLPSNDDDFYIGFFVWLAFVAWLFSQPPYFTFPYFKIYMPSFFMYKILPMFRAYCRFGIVVMLAISVLAGFGLKFILERFKNNRAKTAFASLMCALVLFEFLNFPPFKIIDMSKYPRVYDWLKQEKGDFAIAEYPLDTESPNEYYKFCQTIHEKKIINGTSPGTFGNSIAKSIWKLSDPRTARVLNWLSVKYVIIHASGYAESNDIEIADEFEKIKRKRLPGLKFIKNFGDTDVYEIIAGQAGAHTNE
ncbi:MAG: hypothetical protein PHO42_00275 [Candidatus Omnitrophica bacterium]|nr:hypothetical protein [Candidatus Omnitrophota bacterium]